MTVKFVLGPNREPIPNNNMKQEIEHALKTCATAGFYNTLNKIYNTENHFNTFFGNETYKFLQDVSQLANSPHDAIEVMGGIHSDTGHNTMVLQFSPSTGPAHYPMYVRDFYIRFQIKLASPRKLRVLNPFMVYHFLVLVPQLMYLETKPPGIIHFLTGLDKHDDNIYNCIPLFNNQYFGLRIA